MDALDGLKKVLDSGFINNCSPENDWQKMESPRLEVNSCHRDSTSSLRNH
jgi:hypothetical protein